MLGATGSVGLVAVQAARLLGARRVVAAGRSEAGLERAASLGGRDRAARRADDLVAAFKDAFGGNGPSYVFDPLWGAPAAAAARAAAPWATIVNLGQSAGATSEARLGGRPVQEPLDPRAHELRRARTVLAEHYRRLVGHVMSGEIAFGVEQMPLDDVAAAWQRQADGAGTARRRALTRRAPVPSQPRAPVTSQTPTHPGKNKVAGDV